MHTHIYIYIHIFSKILQNPIYSHFIKGRSVFEDNFLRLIF